MTTTPTPSTVAHGMIPGSHERPDGPECRCGVAWDRWNDRCATIAARLDYLRGEIEAERISYAEIAELEGLRDHIDPADDLLRLWAWTPSTEL